MMFVESSLPPNPHSLEVVLPDKMKYNLAAIRSFSFIDDIKVMILTVLAVFK